ncbi:DUF4153 domain-containing protein [Tsuneonella mangrovi]|uniref:DUF4153 domain-containing protein n=1 Tax=Tsuneonella mangrovi TaxID=1982042 RepID=UPI000BA211F6|nr:DUF4153 domain-containing protein [Tsuneonella mangrovi]
MTDTDTGGQPHSDWALRPWVLGVLLALAGLLIHFAGDGDGPGTKVGWRAALIAFLFFGPIAFAFLVERERWKGPLAFALGAGVVMAGLAWRAVGGGDAYADPQFGFMAGVIATGLALPLYQAGFHRLRFRTPYRALHNVAWNDAISGAGALAFVGAAWIALALLSQLFLLLKIEFLRDLMREDWFGWTWSGATFGAALGVLRNELKILGTLQRVVMVVLSILGVPMALGLAVFLLAMIVSGPDVLWEATRSATPILLSCAAGAWVLANAIVRDSDEEASGNRLLRIAGLVLALCVFPLTVFAAVSLGTRVAQHGLSPERLWGLVSIAVACAYGLAWLVAVVRGWKGGKWMDRLRDANLHLAAGISVIALLLALPILDFGAVSASNQVARLESGKVSADDFDYTALRWDFGDAGRRALVKLADGKGDVAKFAKEAQAQKRRPYRYFTPREASNFTLRVQPADPALEKLVRDYLRTNPWSCNVNCVAIETGKANDGKRIVAIVQGVDFVQVTLPVVAKEPSKVLAAKAYEGPSLKAGSKVEIRDVQKRYIFVDGKPLDRPLDDD